MSEQETQEYESLKARIERALEEIRTVMPGTEIVLAFQLGVIFTEIFQRLPLFVQYIHYISLGLLFLTVALLMAPAPFHRIADSGHHTKHMHRYTSYMLVTAMFFLASGLSTEAFVIMTMIASVQIATTVAGIAFIFLLILWFVYPYIRRRSE